MKRRLLYYKLQPYLQHKNALVVVGMRQVGKTTLLKQIFDDIKEAKIWFDLDNPLDQKVFEEIDYNAIYIQICSMAGYNPKSKGRLFVFIDEIQNYPQSTKIVKYLIDHFGVKFLLTGSSSFYLKNLFPESLSGRKFLFQLNPLSYREYLYFKDVLSLDEVIKTPNIEGLKSLSVFDYSRLNLHYEDYLNFGGFPEVVVTDQPSLKQEILKNIFKSFFEKDIKILSDYKDVRDLRDLLILLTPRVGSMLDITKLSSELGVERVKVYSYLEFLQGTFMIRLLPKFTHSLDRNVAGGRKVYFADNGILNTIAPVNEAQLFENAVVNQLADYGELSFYNKRNTAEIDVIINKEVALEIKSIATQEYKKELLKNASSLGLSKCFLISKKFVDLKDVIYGCQL